MILWWYHGAYPSKKESDLRVRIDERIMLDGMASICMTIPEYPRYSFLVITCDKHVDYQHSTRGTMGILASKHLIVFVLEDDLSDSAGPIHSLKEKPLAARCFAIFRIFPFWRHKKVSCSEDGLVFAVVWACSWYEHRAMEASFDEMQVEPRHAIPTLWKAPGPSANPLSFLRQSSLFGQRQTNDKQ